MATSATTGPTPAEHTEPVPEHTVPAEPASAEPAGLRGLWHRFEHLVRELGKFGVVGALAFVIDTVVFNLALHPTGQFWAKVISTCFAASAAFIGNRWWTWRDRPRSALHREYSLYFVFNAVGLGIALGCLWVSHNGLGYVWPSIFHSRLADNFAGQIVGTALGTLFRLWGYRRFVFPATATVPEAVEAEAVEAEAVEARAVEAEAVEARAVEAEAVEARAVEAEAAPAGDAPA